VAEAVRYYADQHVPRPVVEGLRRRGIDILTAQEAGRCALPDPDQLTFATSEGRVLVTFDSDFLALHQAGASHVGIAWCPATKYSIGELIQMLVLLHAVVSSDEMRNHVEHL
jgi:predicted nuclease of predicted toxin-antitoxin system